MTELKVVFFASLKESMGMDSVMIDIALPVTIKELKSHIAQQLEKGTALESSGIQASINFEFAREADLVKSYTDEVAFFPPVTGG